MFTTHFYGHEISDYGKQHKRVDYRTLSQAFDCVLNNEIMQQTEAAGIGYWEPCGNGEEYREDSNGNCYSYRDAMDKIDELQEEIGALEAREQEAETEEEAHEIRSQIDELQENVDCLDEEHYREVFQWYIVDDNGARILEEFGEILYYNETLDMYLWGITHYGTSWDYVLTDIPCTGTASEAKE